MTGFRHQVTHLAAMTEPAVLSAAFQYRALSAGRRADLLQTKSL